MTDAPNDPLGEHDDIVAGFQVESRAVRGRVSRLGETLDLILSAHDYPEPVARMLGETVLLAGLVGNALKFDGRLIVQAQGKGPLAFLVAEYVAGEGVRGYAKLDREAYETAAASKTDDESWVKCLLGEGLLALTIDHGPSMEPYQGVVPLEGDSLIEAAETYFRQSEQLPTRIRVAVGQHWDEAGTKTWRGGGMMLQAFASDETRGEVADDWDHCRALFETIEDAELLDPDLSAGTLLYRLFNEDGVRLFEPMSLPRRCGCDRQHLAVLLQRFSQDDRDHMLVDGKIVMTCEYCNKDWAFTPQEVGG